MNPECSVFYHPAKYFQKSTQQYWLGIISNFLFDFNLRPRHTSKVLHMLEMARDS